MALNESDSDDEGPNESASNKKIRVADIFIKMPSMMKVPAMMTPSMEVPVIITTSLNLD